MVGLCLLAAPLAVGAQSDEQIPLPATTVPSVQLTNDQVVAATGLEATSDGELIEIAGAALSAVDFDPWMIQEDEIEPRRADTLSFERAAQADVDAASEAVVDAERELEAAVGVLEGAVDHRAAMETEVEGYSIAIWELGDHGLQEAYGSEAERARQAQTVVATTEALIERVELADAAIVDAESEVARVEAVLAERRVVEAMAMAVLGDATQIRERFEHMVVVRADAIDRWTHDALESEDETIEMATITSIDVELPIAAPAAASLPGDDVGVVESAAAVPGDEDGEAVAVPTETVTVPIAPIVVNADIAGQVRALLGAARSDGLDMHGGGYRPVADQITLRLAHCGTSGYDIFERPAGACGPPTATPGNSQHELGLAIDFTVDGAILSPASPGFAWLQANAASYGLINLPSEAWHWSTTGG